MRVAIIAGLVRSQIKRIDSFVREGGAVFLDKWEVIYVAARRNTPEILEQDVHMLMEQASEYAHPHIIGISKQDGSIRQRVARQIKEYFRFRWLNNRVLSFLGNDFRGFVVSINDVLAEEEVWGDAVQPQDLRSPLLLPRMCFDCSAPHRDLWALSEQYGDVGNIEHAATAIDRFRSSHFVQVETGLPRRWVDAANKIFDHTGERHASAPFPRNWKYSYQLEDGFHYDVADKNRRAFNFRDCYSFNHAVRANGYLNVDPHGYVRKTA